MRLDVKRFVWLALGIPAILLASPAALVRADLVPVGYWTLDDGQTNPGAMTAVDSSGNGNDGALGPDPATPLWRTGVFGGALRFDGVNDYVAMPAFALPLDITGALSTSVWMGRLGPNASTSGYAPLLGKNESGGSTNDAYYVNSKSDSRIVFGIAPTEGDAVELTSVAAVPNGNWHNVVTTFDPGNRMAIYIDGVLDSELTTGVPTAIRSVATPLTLGNLTGSASTGYSFNGYLDEVKVFNGVLGLPQIQSLATPPSNPPGDPTASSLVAHWKLDDGQTIPSTTTAADAVAPASDGSLSDFDAPPAWEAGRVGGALRFDGTNDRVSMVTAENELDVTGDLSMAFWMKPQGKGAQKYGPLAGKNLSGGSTNDAYFTDFVYTGSVTGVGTTPAGTIEFAITNGGVLFVAQSTRTIAIDDDTWHHVAVTYDDGSRLAIYIDGVFDSELTINVPDACDSKPGTSFSLGNLAPESTTTAYSFKGLLDDVRVYTGVLTPAEVAALAAMGAIPGDADGDGYVDQDDAVILAANWGTGGATWATGDFTGDGVVNAADASIMAANWNPAPGEAAGVPEPTTLVLLLGGLLGLLQRRRRTRSQ